MRKTTWKGLLAALGLATVMLAATDGAVQVNAQSAEDQCTIYSDPNGWVGQTRQFFCDQESQYSGWHWDSAEDDVAEMLYTYCVTRHAGSYGAGIIYYSFLESPSHSHDAAEGSFRCTGIYD
jgi:hypothetical protein